MKTQSNTPLVASPTSYYPHHITLDIGEVADIFRVAPATIYASRSQKKGRGQFPEPLHIPGSNRLIWLRDDVIAFLQNCRGSKENRPVKNRQGAGRPTKLEQHAASQAGLTVKQWRVVAQAEKAVQS